MKASERRGVLFKLFRDFDKVVIEDGATQVEVGLRTLNAMEQDELNVKMPGFRKSAEQFSDSGFRDEYRFSLEPMSKDGLIDLLITMERPTVAANADLAPEPSEQEEEEEAPPPSPEQVEKKAAAKERAAVARWEGERRATLVSLEIAALRDLVVERHTRGMIHIRSVQMFLDAALARMVVDPETGELLLSDDPESENYVGRLTGKARNALIEARGRFVIGLSEKDLRKAAEAPPFSSSGASPSEPAGSPGVTTETPVSSQPPSSPSTPNVDG